MTTIGYYGSFSKYKSELYIAHALENAGFTVIKKSKFNKVLIDCDYVLFAKMPTMDIISQAKEKGIPTICWHFDLYRDNYRKTDVPHFKADTIITTDPDDGHYTIRQAVHGPEKIMMSGEKIHDVIFVGTMYYNERREMVKRANAKVFNKVYGLKLNELLSQTKVVLGDTYPASGCWSRRIFEITGRGGFIVHPKVRGLYDCIPQFNRGEEKETVEYFIDDVEGREELRIKQFEKCPTYDDRIKDLIRIAKLKRK